MAQRNDWIALLEAVYQLDPDREAWTRRLLDACAPVLDEGGGLIACHFQRTPSGVAVEHLVTRGLGATGAAIGAVLQATGTHSELAADLELAWRFRSLSEALGERSALGTEVIRRLSRGRFADGWGGMAHSGNGRALAIGAPLREPRRASAALQARWARVASHIGAALRLQQVLARSGDEGVRVEAVLGSGGEVCSASGEARCPDARAALRDAVQKIDRARTRAGRSDPEEALSLWRALVAGRWSLVDRFERGGRRYVVAIRNEPEVRDARGLSLCEAQVSEYLGLGYSEKEIAYTLGLSASGVSRAVSLALEKLGLPTREELAALFAPNGVSTRLRKIRHEGETLAVASVPKSADEGRLTLLSEAECDVVRAACRGSSSAAIAAERGTSRRTVDNQLSAIYRKLGVHSRTELAARISA